MVDEYEAVDHEFGPAVCEGSNGRRILAVRTEDLQDTWAALMERDAEDYRDPESCGDRYAFTKDADGHEIEIVTA